MPDIQPLLDLGIDPECPSGKDILEEFSDACKKGDQPVVEAFLRAGLWSVDELQVYRPSSYDGPPLHRACEGGSLAVVQALVAAGFDIEIRDKDDDTPMMTANNHKRPAVAEWLAAQGANPNPINNRGYSAAAVAARSKDQRLLKALAAQGASLDTGRFPAIEVAHESPEIVQLLLDLGANPDVASSFGLPVLHALCLIPAASASAQLLVDKGADAGPARDGVDAWFCAKWRGSKVKGLKATGDNKARLAWLTAARDGGELPKPPGGDVDVPGPTGETALLLAVTRKDWAMATELLRRGANPLRHGTRTVKLADTFDALTRIASQRWDENRALRAAKEPVPDVDSGERAAFTRALLDAIRAGGPGRPGGWPSDLRCAALPIAVRIPDTALLLELLELGAPLWSKDTYNYVPFDLLVTASDPAALLGALSAMERRGDLARLGAEMAADPDLVAGRWDGEPEVRTTLALLGAAVCKAADAGRPAAVKQLLAALPPGFKRPMSLDGYPVWNRMTPDRTAVMEPYQDVIRELLSAGVDLGSWGRQAAEFGSLGVDTFVGGNGRPALDKVLLDWVCNEPFYAAWAKVSGVPRDALPVDDPEAVGRAEADDAVWAELARSIAGVDGAAYHCAWARAGMTARIRGAARAGVPLEPQQPRSWTPLRFAARAGQVEVLRALAELGADLDRAGYWGSTALHTAIGEGTLDALKPLLALGARTDGPSGYRLLPSAAKRGTEFVNALIDAGARADRPRAGNTLLHASRDPELIARLAAAGGLRARNREGQTPLHTAVAREDVGAVKAMLAALPPGERAEMVGLVERNERRTALHLAAAGGNAALVDVLCTVGVNVPDQTGTTPLMLAASAGHGDAVARLLAAGADRALRDNRGTDAANHGRRHPSVLALLDAPPPDIKRLPEPSSLGWALLVGEADSARRAIEAASPAEINALGPDGFHALHHAMTRGDADLVDLLLDRGANPSLPDRSGHKPRNMAFVPGFEATAAVFERRGVHQVLLEFLDAGTWYADLQDALNRRDVNWLLDGLESGKLDLQRIRPQLSLLSWAVQGRQHQLVQTLLAMGVRADVRVKGDGIFASALQAAFAHATTLPALLQVGLKLPPDALHALVRLRSLDRTAFEELWDRFVAMGADEDAPAPDGGPSARALLDEALEDEADRYEDTWE